MIPVILVVLFLLLIPGNRQIVVDPEHPIASPLGWSTFKSRNGVVKVNLDTQGNNVFDRFLTSGVCSK